MQHSGSLVAAHELILSKACGILVPSPRTEPMSPALQSGFLTTEPPVKSLVCTILIIPSIPEFIYTYVEKAMAPHSSTLAWKIPWMEEPGGLQSMGSLRVGHDWATSLSRIEKGNGSPLHCSCLENPRDGGAWWAAIYGVVQSQTQLKRLSSSSNSILETAWLLRDVTYSSKL